MNRSDFQKLAAVRLKEAEALLAAGHWEGAYYLAGYAVECGLKACVLARVERDGVIFEEKQFAANCWTHDINRLLACAALVSERNTKAAADPQFDANWSVCLQWSEQSRYRWVAEPEARQLIDAIARPTNGVLSWLSLRC